MGKQVLNCTALEDINTFDAIIRYQSLTSALCILPYLTFVTLLPQEDKHLTFDYAVLSCHQMVHAATL